jgi:hypothetical protein
MRVMGIPQLLEKFETNDLELLFRGPRERANRAVPGASHSRRNPICAGTRIRARSTTNRALDHACDEHPKFPEEI